jgi:hypothetical protein
VVTTDGPFVESKEHLGGFYIIQAEDLDGALAWASRVTGAIKVPIQGPSVRGIRGLRAWATAMRQAGGRRGRPGSSVRSPADRWLP